MLVVECPNQYTTVDPQMPYSVYMAGGMVNCPDWRSDLIQLLDPIPGTLLNPRQSDLLFKGPDNDYKQMQSHRQIIWSMEHMHRAGAILFWFPCEHSCPVSLLELGNWLKETKTLFVGIHPNYERKKDIVFMIEQNRPKQTVVHSLWDLANEVSGGFLLNEGKR